jgi:chorismate dehydratase
MKIKITAVNYLNTFPFKYGLEHNKKILEWAEINYAHPAECAQMLVNKKTHIALAPVAILAFYPELKIVSNYCLSTNDIVDTVKLYSKKPIDEIQSIILDYQSLSSVSLVKVLMQFYWKKNVQYIQGYNGFENEMNADAMVVIGDRTFDLNGKFPYEYDLASEWFKFTNKPFVFAAWITNHHLTNEQIENLNEAMQQGLDNIDNVIEDAANNPLVLKNFNTKQKNEIINNYLKNRMFYQLTADRLEALQMFIEYVKQLNTQKILVP